MTPEEAVEVLGHAASYDNRTASRAEAIAWAAALPDVPQDVAVAAVVAWYGEHRERVMPADVTAYARSLRDRRHPSSRPLSEVIADLPPRAEFASLSKQASMAQMRRVIAYVSAKRALPPGDDAAPAGQEAAS